VRFGSPAKPKPAPTPPTERDANLEGVRKRASAGPSTMDATQISGVGGVPETGGAKSILGG
jgi:hypothetical protein